MLRLLFLLNFIFFINAPAFAQEKPEPTGLQLHNLTGPVKLLVKTLFVYRDTNAGGDRYLKFTDSIWFNRQGNIKRLVKRDSVGTLAYLDVYTYDSVGHLRSLKSYDFPGKKKDMSEYRYYNAYGQCILKKEFDWGFKSFDQDKYIYDNKGRCIKSLSASSDLPLLAQFKVIYNHETRFYYDSLSRLSVAERFNDYGKDAYSKTDYYYLPERDSCVLKWRNGSKTIQISDKAGLQLHSRNYNEVGNLIGWTSYTYEEHGRLTSMQTYSNGQLIFDLKKSYSGFDKHNNFSSVEINVNGKPTQYIEHQIVYWSK